MIYSAFLIRIAVLQKVALCCTSGHFCSAENVLKMQLKIRSNVNYFNY